MPKKIRELKAMLKAGFIWEPGKGGHSKWHHPLAAKQIVLSGHGGADAKRYQEQEVREQIEIVQNRRWQ